MNPPPAAAAEPEAPPGRRKRGGDGTSPWVWALLAVLVVLGAAALFALCVQASSRSESVADCRSESAADRPNAATRPLRAGEQAIGISGRLPRRRGEHAAGCRRAPRCGDASRRVLTEASAAAPPQASAKDSRAEGDQRLV